MKLNRFRISTMLLTTAIVAILLGWYIDHRPPVALDLVGQWEVSEEFMSDGRAVIFIVNRNGTFIFREMGSWKNVAITIHGTYEIRPDNTCSVSCLSWVWR
jgi:hypothetical protein